MVIGRAVELRYTTDGETWAKSRPFGSLEAENVVMGKNFYIQFIAPDDNSMVVIFHQVIHSYI